MAVLPLPAYIPVYPVTKTVKPRQRVTKLPSWGIEQRKTEGLNQTAPEWSVKWILSPAEANDLDAFLAERARVGEWFLWLPPSGVSGLFRCDDWSKQVSSCSIYEVQATFRQVFTFTPPLFAEPGAFVLSGSAVSMTRSWQLSGSTGTFALTGAAVSFSLGGGSPPPSTGDEASFWSDWAYYDPDIFLYGEDVSEDTSTASFWSDWKYYDPDIFLYEEAASSVPVTASTTPAYWNRWQSWTEDPPLLFEEST
jgi:phage-related protein